MPDFVREHIRLRKFSRHSEASLQFIVEAEIDIYLLVTGTVERSAGGFRHAAGGVYAVAKQHKLRVAVSHALRCEDLRPGLLGVIKHERDKLHQRLLPLIAGRVGLPAHLSGRVGAATHSRQRKKIPLKYQTQHQQDDEAADSNVDAAKIKTTAAATAAVVSTIFDVLTLSARRPTHDGSPVKDGMNVAHSIQKRGNRQPYYRSWRRASGCALRASLEDSFGRRSEVGARSSRHC